MIAQAPVYTQADARDGKALALFAACDTWQQGHTHDGRPFFAIPGSEPNLLHMADQNDCSCADRRQRGTVCKHMRAVRYWMAAFRTGAVSPRREAGATAQDDRAALTPEGAGYLVEQDMPRLTADDIWPPCAAGCGDIVDRVGESCLGCGSERAYRERIAAKIAAGVR
jgi:hypothetical protein